MGPSTWLSCTPQIVTYMTTILNPSTFGPFGIAFRCQKMVFDPGLVGLALERFMA